MSDYADYDQEMQSHREDRLRQSHNPQLAREIRREREIARLAATFDSADGNCDDGANYDTEAEREEMREEKHRAESRVDGCHKKHWRDEV